MKTSLEKAIAYLDASKLLLRASNRMEDIGDMVMAGKLLQIGNQIADKGLEEIDKK